MSDSPLNVRSWGDCVAKLGGPIRSGRLVESDSDQGGLVKSSFIVAGGGESNSSMVPSREPENSFAAQSRE